MPSGAFDKVSTGGPTLAPTAGGPLNDKVIVVTYGQLPQEEARQWSPNVVLLDDRNEIKPAA